MLSQMGIGLGRTDSSPNSLFTRRVSNSSTPSSTMNNASSATSPITHDTVYESTDIEESLQANKELSLAYQMMRAIMRLNKGSDSLEFQNKDIDEFNLDFEYSFSQLQIESQSFETGDGTTFNLGAFQQTIDLSLSIEFSEENGTFSMDFSFEFSSSQFMISATREENKQVDPLILNLDGNDFSFDMSYETEFDLDADGQLDRFYSLGSQNYFLALDANENGEIDDGLELFGDAGGAVDGFAALSQYDTNDDQLINAQDEVFNQLLLLSFGKDGSQQLHSLTGRGIVELSLQAMKKSEVYQDNNQLISESDFSYSDGRYGRVGDFLITAR